MTSPPTPRPSRRRVIGVVSIPIAYAVVGVLHPTENPSIGDPTDLWLGLHLAQLVLIGAVGWMFWTLVEGVRNRGATIVRALVLPYVVLYVTMDAVLGLAWGFVARQGGQLPEADQAAGQRLLDDLLDPTTVGMALYFGSGVALLALVAATIAAHHQAPPASRWLLGTGGLLFVAGHAPPIGPIAMILIAVAVAMLVRTLPPEDRRFRPAASVTDVP